MNQTETCCRRSLKVTKWSRLTVKAHRFSNDRRGSEVLNLDHQTKYEIKMMMIKDKEREIDSPGKNQ